MFPLTNLTSIICLKLVFWGYNGTPKQIHCVCRGLTKLTTDVITQRKILSAVSGIFDPIGFMSPFTSSLILKQLWCVRDQIWDAPVPGEIEVAFAECDVEKLNIPDIKLVASFILSWKEPCRPHTCDHYTQA